MKKIAVVMSKPPHGLARGREGLDAVLALSVHNAVSLFFIGNGTLHLLSDQQPEKILMRDYITSLQLLELYDINNCFVCKEDLVKYQIINPNIPVIQLNRKQIVGLLNTQESIIHF